MPQIPYIANNFERVPQNIMSKTFGMDSFKDINKVPHDIGGFYLFGATNFTPAGGGTTLGTANVAYGAHAFIVIGAISTNMIVRVSGTSINDQGVRIAADTVDIDTSGGAIDDYFETTKKWIGQITFTLLSGTGVTVNNGMVKYWDNNNTDFVLKGVEVLGFSGKDDATPQMKLIHHKATGWTYNAAAEPTPPAAIIDLQTDYNTEFQFKKEENFAWKRDNLDTHIDGKGSEGILFIVDINDDKSIAFANFSIMYVEHYH